MHIIFLNPQGNFDSNDSYWTEHPDFGGQLVYVKEVCIALAKMGHKVDIITRQIDDPDWPEFSKKIESYREIEEGLRIIRVPCGGPKFLNKERLWEHLDEYTDQILSFYGDYLPDFSTAHYGDGGYSGVLLKQKAGLGFTFTGHSLGAQKLDKLGLNLNNLKQMNGQYHFSKRITAERLSMTHSAQVITSTVQERLEQYGHPLYEGAVETVDDSKFSVIPPGVNTKIFNREESKADVPIYKTIAQKMSDGKKPYVIVSSRLDEKKNIIGIVTAYAASKPLQEIANLAIFVRGVENPFSDISGLNDAEQDILKPILDLIQTAGISDRVSFFNLKSQKELAAAYRYFADLGSVFALTAFYEPFGLAPIEAAACGLVAVATKNGGPSEIFEDGSGILVDPFDEKEIAKGLIKGIQEYRHFSTRGVARVHEKYTWEKTAASYFRVIQKAKKQAQPQDIQLSALNDVRRIKQYLSQK